IRGGISLKPVGDMEGDMKQEISWPDTGAATHVGKMRQQNEDSYLVLPSSGVWAVADGMGGHSAGDLASSTLVGELKRISPPSSAPDLLAGWRATVVGGH